MLVGETIAVAKAGAEIYQLAKKEGWVDRLISSLRKKHRVLVLGPTGTGKSNLIESLTQLVPEVIDRMNRTEFAERHRIEAAGSLFEFTDTPGQARHKSARLNIIREEMAKGIDGILDVVSYGYHEGRGNKSKAVTEDSRPNPEYLQARRKVEIDALAEWTPLLGGGVTASWNITVVTKADLWWDERDAVIAHYESGNYSASLGDVKALRGAVIEYCSVFHRYFDEVPLPGSFDESDRVRTRQHFVKTLIAAIGKAGSSRG